MIDRLALHVEAGDREELVLIPSQIRKFVNARRARRKEDGLAVSTVSTVLRTATQKGLLKKTEIDGAEHLSSHKHNERETTPVTRSPNTAYQAICAPTEVFRATMTSLVTACPKASRPELIAHLAKLIGLSSKTRATRESNSEQRRAGPPLKAIDPGLGPSSRDNCSDYLPESGHGDTRGHS